MRVKSENQIESEKCLLFRVSRVLLLVAQRPRGGVARGGLDREVGLQLKRSILINFDNEDVEEYMQCYHGY